MRLTHTNINNALVYALNKNIKYNYKHKILAGLLQTVSMSMYGGSSRG